MLDESRLFDVFDLIRDCIEYGEQIEILYAIKEYVYWELRFPNGKKGF